MAVQAPQVQTLAQIMADLEPADTAQTNIIKNKQSGLDTKYNEQLSGLEAKKASGFNTINTNATGKGMAFSGIPSDEQATYLGETYLPAVANLKTSQNEESTALEKELADLYSNRYNTAFSTLGTQQSALNDWNMQQMQNEFTAGENAKNRAADAANNTETVPTVTQAMTDYMSNAILSSQAAGTDWKKNYSTESVIDQLINDYATNAEDSKKIKNMVYTWRKNAYGF